MQFFDSVLYQSICIGICAVTNNYYFTTNM